MRACFGTAAAFPSGQTEQGKILDQGLRSSLANPVDVGYADELVVVEIRIGGLERRPWVERHLHLVGWWLLWVLAASHARMILAGLDVLPCFLLKAVAMLRHQFLPHNVHVHGMLQMVVADDLRYAWFVAALHLPAAELLEVAFVLVDRRLSAKPNRTKLCTIAGRLRLGMRRLVFLFEDVWITHRLLIMRSSIFVWEVPGSCERAGFSSQRFLLVMT